VACCAHGLDTPPGKGVVVEFHPDIQSVLEAVLTTYVNAMVTDMEKLAVAYALEGLESTIKYAGVACLAISEETTKSTYGELIMNNILLLLKEKAKCQTVLTQDDDDEEDGDHDSLITDAVCDVIATLAKVIGENFMEYFQAFSKFLVKYTKANRIHSDRSMAIGCFGEVIGEIGPAAGEQYAKSLFPILKAGCADPMETVRRNSAYTIGVLCQNAPEATGPMYLQMLQWLYPLCVRSSDEVVSDAGGADIDNALAAVARMIMVAGPSAIPLEQVLPVMLNAMPLRSDFGEGVAIFNCFCGLATDGDASMLANLPQALVAFSQVLSEDLQYNDETKTIVVSGLKHLAGGAHQQVLQNAISQVPEEVGAVIDAAVRS
jgi:importin-4